MRLNMWQRFGLIALALTTCLLLSCSALHQEKIFRNEAVVSADKIATQIGLEVLKQGGNAIDAACAISLALAVTYPENGNIGGGGFALIYSADSQQVYFLDFREKAPLAVTSDFYFVQIHIVKSCLKKMQKIVP